MKRSIVSPGFVKRTLAKLLKLDQALGIVVDGNTASQAIAIGDYVNLINSTISGKSDGIYVATGAVSANGTVTATDISGNAIGKGISNALNDQIGSIGLDKTVALVPLANRMNGFRSLDIMLPKKYTGTHSLTVSSITRVGSATEYKTDFSAETSFIDGYFCLYTSSTTHSASNVGTLYKVEYSIT